MRPLVNTEGELVGWVKALCMGLFALAVLLVVGLVGSLAGAGGGLVLVLLLVFVLWVAPIIVIVLVAGSRSRSRHYAWWGVGLGWLGAIIATILIVVQREVPPHARG